MRFQKTVLLDNAALAALHNRELTFQCGQWFRCSDNESKPSRFIGVTKGGTIHAVHPDSVSNKCFAEHISVFKNLQKRG